MRTGTYVKEEREPTEVDSPPQTDGSERFLEELLDGDAQGTRVHRDGELPLHAQVSVRGGTPAGVTRSTDVRGDGGRSRPHLFGDELLHRASGVLLGGRRAEHLVQTRCNETCGVEHLDHLTLSKMKPTKPTQNNIPY